jgi:hypothetical protein
MFFANKATTYHHKSSLFIFFHDCTKNVVKLRFKVLKCDFISKDKNMCNICVMSCKKEGDSKY